MASAQRNVDFVLEQLAEAEDVSARKMFGEYAIYCRDKLVALFCDDQLFIKPTDAGRAFLGKIKEVPPYPGAKPYFSISGAQCEDGEWLSELVRITERELPAKKPKARSPRDAKSAKSPKKLDKKTASAPPRQAKRAARASASKRSVKKRARRS